MASERQIRANRENAKRSTGPRSPAGKRKVRANALKHGLSARTLKSTPTPQTKQLAVLAIRGGPHESAVDDLQNWAAARNDINVVEHYRHFFIRKAWAALNGGKSTDRVIINSGVFDTLVVELKRLTRYERHAHACLRRLEGKMTLDDRENSISG